MTVKIFTKCRKVHIFHRIIAVLQELYKYFTRLWYRILGSFRYNKHWYNATKGMLGPRAPV